jgi:hypothetical protein
MGIPGVVGASIARSRGTEMERRTSVAMLVAIMMLVAACSSDGSGTGADPADAQQSTGSTAPTSDTQPSDQGGNTQGLPPGGDGQYVIDGETFDATVYRCEPFTAPGQQPDDRELSVLAFRGGSEGLEVEIGIGNGIGSDGQQFDQQVLRLFHSKSGASGLEQFEGVAAPDQDGVWYPGQIVFEPDLEPLSGVPYTLEGNRLRGGPLTLEQTWPEEAEGTVVVQSWDLTVPDETWSEC